MLASDWFHVGPESQYNLIREAFETSKHFPYKTLNSLFQKRERKAKLPGWNWVFRYCTLVEPALIKDHGTKAAMLINVSTHLETQFYKEIHHIYLKKFTETRYIQYFLKVINTQRDECTHSFICAHLWMPSHILSFPDYLYVIPSYVHGYFYWIVCSLYMSCFVFL